MQRSQDWKDSVWTTSGSNVVQHNQNWPDLTFGEFSKELDKAIKASGGEKLTKLSEMEWMEVFETKKAEAQTLKAEIEKTDKEIDPLSSICNLA